MDNLAHEDMKMSLQSFFHFVDAKPEEERWELMNGIPVCLASPNGFHQDISMELSVIFGSYFRGKKCKVRAAPSDIILFEDHDDLDPVVFQPDLYVFCDKNQDDGKRIHGTPTLVVEIWSGSDHAARRMDKMSKYKLSGVKEIWEIFPNDELVKISALTDGKYDIQCFTFHMQIYSNIFDGLCVDLSEFASDIRPL